MNKILKYLVVVLISIFSTTVFSQFEQARSFEIEEEPKVKVKLLSEYDTFSPGQEWWIVFELKHDPGWHTYYKEPGDSGYPTAIEWELPEGFKAGEIHWPEPIKFDTAGLVSYGYKDTAYLSVKISTEENIKSGKKFLLKAKVNWLACEVVCIPEEQDLEWSISSGAEPVKSKSYDSIQGHLPKEKVPTEKEETKREEEEEQEEVTSPKNSFSLSILFLAFIGGLILNIMPCVLPVISLKAFNLVRQAEESRPRLIYLTTMYTLGVIISFWILAGFMILLRSLGHDINWGLLFQFPEFVIGFCCVVFVFALSLLGVYQLQAPSGSAVQGMANLENKEGAIGSFFTGVLATLLSTPCTAPILASVLLVALTQSNLIILLIFTMIGIGLAFPFILFAIFPSWTRFVPKPGMWTVRFKEFVGILMLATLVWLLIRLVNLAGVEIFAATLWFLVFLGIACWMIGNLIQFDSRPGRKLVVWVNAFALCLFSFGLTIYPALSIAKGIDNETDYHWQSFDEENFQTALKQEAIVFLDFTADWCINCKVNENLVLKTKAVKEVLDQTGTISMVVDFTKRDPKILKMLNEFGSVGVPLYVLYSPRFEEPYIFPQLLSKKMVIEKLKEAARDLPEES